MSHRCTRNRELSASANGRQSAEDHGVLPRTRFGVKVEHAEWDDGAWLCNWHIKLRVFTDNMKCSGTNRFEEVGLVDDAAVHEMPALPGDDEVAAIAAEQEAGAAAEAQADAAAESDAADAAQSADNQKADAAESDKSAPDADDGKEG